MYKADIVAGLKNTMDRGYTLEQAIQSFINAGYSKDDVLDSAEALRSQPSFAMQVTAPDISEEKKEKKPGFFKRLHLSHVHSSDSNQEKQEPRVYIKEESKSSQQTSQNLGTANVITGMGAEDKDRIRRLEIDIKSRDKPQTVQAHKLLHLQPAHPQPVPLRRPVPQVETTAIIGLSKVAPKKISLDKRSVALQNIKSIKPVQKPISKLPQERTEILGLARTPKKRSDNAIFVILILLLLMLLGALLFSFFYKNQVLEIINKLLGE